ncbi:MAG: hypothetical protein ACRD1I_08215 [Terriglobia bacterium]
MGLVGLIVPPAHGFFSFSWRYAAMMTCYAYCPNVMHGSEGWKGPIRTGDNAAEQAAGDAEKHNLEHPGHRAAASEPVSS